MRKLKHHEYRLLKKADFLQWKRESNLRETRVVRRYRVQNPEDYHEYNKIIGLVTKLANQLKQLPPDDLLRQKRTGELLEKLYQMGVINTKDSLEQCAKVTVSALCRRRLPVVMVRLKFAETPKEACTLVEQGHIRIGPETVTDNALLVTRNMEDFITWVDASKIKRKIATYNDEVDDFDLMNT